MSFWLLEIQVSLPKFYFFRWPFFLIINRIYNYYKKEYTIIIISLKIQGQMKKMSSSHIQKKSKIILVLLVTFQQISFKYMYMWLHSYNRSLRIKITYIKFYTLPFLLALDHEHLLTESKLFPKIINVKICV